MKKTLPVFLLLFGGACVSLDTPALTPQAIGKGQRTILMVYPSPGPWVITESESKAEGMAKTLPVFSFVVQSMQDDRYRTASDTLQKYLPPWKPAELLEPKLLDELGKSGFPGKFIPVAETDQGTATVRLWNRATDTLDWQNKYFYGDPSQPFPRDYSRIMDWDDALALEVNLLPYVAADDEGNMVPTLGASTRLFRCQTMHLLWEHQDVVDDKSAAKSLYEFETLPQQLMDRWQALVPKLAATVSTSLHTTLFPALSTSTFQGGGKPAVANSSATAPGALKPTASGGRSTGLIPSGGIEAAPLDVAVSSGTAPAFAAPVVSTAAATMPIAVAVSSGTVPTVAAPVVSTGTTPAPVPPSSGPP
jgi:hypothetical protein